MSRAYNVADARKEFAAILTLAESGKTVVIERNGVRFILASEPACEAKATASRRHSSYLKILHPSLEQGEWDWQMGERGLEFVARKESLDVTKARAKKVAKGRVRP